MKKLLCIVFLKKNTFFIGIGVLVFLGIVFPQGIPFFIFLAVLLFTFSEYGKNLFDLDKFENSGNTSEKKPPADFFLELKKPEKKDASKKTPDNNTHITHSFSQFFMNKKTPNPSNSSFFVIGIIGFLLISVVSDGFVSIPAGSTGVVFDKLSGGVKEETLPSGINFKLPFFQQVTIVNTRIQEETINSSRDPIEALTKDGQKVNIDVTVQYVIKEDVASKLYEEVGMNYQSSVIKAGVRSVVREVITGYDSTELFNQEFRKKAQEEMKNSLSTNYSQKHISLVDILIRDVKFSAKYLDAIEEKKVAEQQIQKAEFEKQEAEIRKEKTIIEASAEAEAISLKGEALSKTPEVIQLKFVEKMAPNINWGILPDGSIPMINPESLQKNSNNKSISSTTLGL